MPLPPGSLLLDLGTARCHVVGTPTRLSGEARGEEPRPPDQPAWVRPASEPCGGGGYVGPSLQPQPSPQMMVALGQHLDFNFKRDLGPEAPGRLFPNV